MKTKRQSVRSLGYASFGALSLSVVSACAALDLRPAELVDNGVTAGAERSARALLTEVEEAAGRSAWARHQTTEVVMNDDFGIPFAMTLGLSVWDGETLSFRWVNDTFDGQFEYLDGDREGRLIGMQAFETYVRAPGEALAFRDDFNTRFFVGAYAYLNEIAFRIGRAGTVAQLEDADFAGRRHHRVFATWGDAAPQDDVDQYVVWVDAETKRVRLVEYTLRDYGQSFGGVAYYDDYRDVDGVQVAYKLTVASSVKEDYEEGYVHQAVLRSVRYDGVQPSALYPDPERGSLGRDRKPASTR